MVTTTASIGVGGVFIHFVVNGAALPRFTRADRLNV